MDDWNDLAIFVSVAEHGGFSAASRALGVPKSSLSRRLQLLEERLGVRLVQRTSRRFTVTDVGEEVLEHARAMRIEAEAAESVARRRVAEPSGTIRVTCSAGMSRDIMGPLLPRFMRRHPKVDVFLHATNRIVDLVEERFDLALRMIRHEARTCTIQCLTGLSEDRIRKLYRAYLIHLPTGRRPRRHRGQSPRQSGIFLQSASLNFEASTLASMLCVAGLLSLQGNLAGAKQYRNCQFFTPETSRTTHFFWDYLHDYALDDPNVSLSLYHSMVAGFNEDKAIIEAQQKTLEADPTFQMNAIVADAPLTHFRRTLARMIEQERAALKAVA